MKKNYIYAIIAVIIVAAAGFWLANKPDQPKAPKFFSPSEVKSTDVVIKITEEGFEPAELEIKKDQRVVWVNETSDFAWPASNPHPTHTAYSGFDPEEPLAIGEAWAFVFDQTGNWGVHDHLKPGKRGMIKVSE